MDLELSLYIGKIITIIYLLVGLALLANPTHYGKVYRDIITAPGLMLVNGIGAVLLGMILIMAHNFWVGEWYLVITLIGWIALLKGAFFLLLPGVHNKIWTPFFAKSYSMRIFGLIALLVGLYFGYFSFVA